MKIINKKYNKLLALLLILFTFTFVYCTDGVNYFNDYVEANYVYELDNISYNGESDKFNLFTFSDRLSSQGIKELPSNYLSQSAIEINEDVFKDGNLKVGDKIAFKVPEIDLYEAIIDKVTVDINNVLSIRGQIINSEYSYIVISIYKDKITASINIVEENEFYTITFEEDNQSYYLNKIDTDVVNNTYEDECLIPDNLEVDKGFSSMSNNTYNLDEEVTIDVMFVYTEVAKNWADTNVGSIELALSNAIEEGQLVLDNSKVGINLRMVHSEQVNYISSHNPDTDLFHITFLKGNNDEMGYMDEVHDLRDEYGADLVVFVGDGYSITVGRAWGGSVEGFEEYGFSVSDVKYLSGNYTVIHELGHNMGCNHSRNQQQSPASDNGGAFEYSTGWRWIGDDGKGYVSVMTYPEGYYTVPIFSNPNVTWQGQPTGSYTGEYAPADNARSLREMKHIIANYRLDAETLNQPASIKDPNLLTVISKMLNKSAEEITKRDMANFKSLSLRHLNISDLGGLEQCINLNYLIISSNKINDLAPLSELKGLEYLFLNDNLIEDLSPLKNLTKLRVIDLGYNNVSDLTAIGDLTRLEFLGLKDNNIVDISAINTLFELRNLKLNNNKVTNIEAIKNLTKLVEISLSSNEIKDISSLSTMTNFRYLNLSSNKIKDVKSIVESVENRVSTESIYIELKSNYLDLSDENSDDMKQINKLKQYENITLKYTPQKNVNVRVYLDENEVYIKKDMNFKLTTSITPENANNMNMIWSSSDEKVVSVDNNGLITGKNPGKALITVEMVDGGYYDTCEVTVLERDFGVTTEEDTLVNGRTVGTDPDGDKLTYSKESDPQKGVVKVEEDGTWVYTPNNNFNGVDKFKVKAEDGNGNYTIITEFITVSPINDQPDVSDYDETIEEDKLASGKVIGTDVDGDKLTYSKETDPQNGIVKVEEDGTWVYTPKSNYNGKAVFKVKVEDGNGGYTISTIKITISPINDQPDVPDYDETIEEDKSANGKVIGTDVDGDKLTYSKETDPQNGIVKVEEDGTWIYTPNSNYNGEDIFKVKVEDSKGGFEISTITITISPINDPPVVSDYNETIEEDKSANGKVIGTDVDKDKLGYSKETDPQNGVVKVEEDGTWVYKPNSNYNGEDVFKVKVEDGNGGFVISIITITISPINDQPVVSDYNETIEEDKSANGKVIGTDVDDDKLTYSKETDPQNGVVKIEEDGTWVYTPNSNYNGEDVFKVKVEDSKGGFAISTITITILPINDPPVFPDYDLNDDNIIDNKDMVILSKYYGIKSEDQSYNSYFDYNSDNIIDLLDIVLLSKQIIKD